MFTVYVLELLRIAGFYVGFSANFEHRLGKHRSGQGAVVTRAHGVKRVAHTEQAATKREAKVREIELVREYSHRGCCWGGDNTALKEPCVNYKPKPAKRRPIVVVPPPAPATPLFVWPSDPPCDFDPRLA